MKLSINVSVSSRSYILSYDVQIVVKVAACKKFPSPLGVIFSLISTHPLNHIDNYGSKFPSPLGVIFSLIFVYL